MGRRKKWLILFGSVFGSIILLIASFNIWVVASTNAKTTGDITELQPRNVALVLGTSPWLTNGQENLFFTNRIEAAATLYLCHKVKKLLVSGDNGTQYYNETAA